jgi:hypothetical protein
MIERMSDLPDHVVGFTAVGEITGEDYEKVLIPAVEDGLKRHSHLNLLYHLGPDFTGFTAKALWNDTKVGLQHITAWKQVAVVTDIDWVENGIKAFRWLMPGKIRVFDDDDIDQAKLWLVTPDAD